MIRFSIVIPCFNAAPWLAAAIHSCLAQTARDLEVIVVDDGSTDGSHEIAAAAAGTDSRVTVLRQANLGVGAARNAGLAIAQGEYVNFLDADDFLDAEKLAVQGAVLDENPDIDCVLCNGRAIDADGAIVMDSLVDPRRLAGPVPLFDLFFSGGQFPPLVPLLRRRAAIAAGGFDEDRRVSGWADTAFWLRLGVAGARYHFVDRALCHYRITAGNMSSDREAMERAAELVYVKLLRDRPAESARALRQLHGRMNDRDAALAGLRACVARVEDESRATADAWRVTRETLHAERVDAQHLRDQLHDAQDRLQRLRAVVCARSARRSARPDHERTGGFVTRIVIFDAGETGRRLWDALAARPTIEVVGVVDVDARRHGRAFLGTTVHPPEWLQAGGWDQVVVGASSASEWRFPLAAVGVTTRQILELPLDGGDAFLAELVTEMFPDPLAAVLDATVPPTGVRVGIFGTGAAGMKVWEVLAEMDAADAVWFVDNNPQQQGRKILGLDVIAPADIASREYDAIVVGSMSRDAIRDQLTRIGVVSRRIITPDVAGPVDQLRRQIMAAMAAFDATEISA